MNDVLVNSMSMFIYAKLDELKCMYTLQNTLNATLALAILAVASSSIVLMEIDSLKVR